MELTQGLNDWNIKHVPCEGDYKEDALANLATTSSSPKNWSVPMILAEEPLTKQQEQVAPVEDDNAHNWMTPIIDCIKGVNLLSERSEASKI